MTQYDPNTDPTRVPPPVYTETVETVVVRESNTGWWIAGILGGVVLIAVLWILFALAIVTGLRGIAGLV